MSKLTIVKNEMLEALERSGYLLESEISRYLANLGYFVESNQVIKDPLTGKSREIDLVAELYEYNEELSKLQIASKVNYVFEIKNNLFPIVLLTKLEYSPNIDTGECLKEIITKPDSLKYYSSDGFCSELFDKNREEIYTQYCSFHKKKENDELMALHPDNIYEGLIKIVQYCEEQLEIWNHIDDDISEDSRKHFSEYFRHFLFLPVLLINDDLFVLKIDESNNRELLQVQKTRLLFNYYYKGEPNRSLIYVVTKQGFGDFMKLMRKVEMEVLANMRKIKKGSA